MRGIVLFITLLLASFTNEPKVTWFDDFLGIAINPAYALSLGGTGNVRISEGSGGILALYALSMGRGVARVRLGEELGNSPFNALNFSGRKNLRYKARVFLNNDVDQATVGLTGQDDPHNVLALVYDTDLQVWIFQAINEGHKLNVPTGFRHEPGRYFTVRIETDAEGARAFINDELVGTAAIEFIPDGLVAEFQVWNMPLEDGSHSQPTLYVDYLSIVQDR